MNSRLYGGGETGRLDLIEQMGDLSLWPTIDHTCLTRDVEDRFLNCKKSVMLFANPSLTVAHISNETEIPRASIYRLIKRCLELHSDGRIYGFRALVKGKRVKVYKRTASSTKSASEEKSQGMAGSFMQLLDNYPELNDFLVAENNKRFKRQRSGHLVHLNHNQIHQRFITKCREIGLSSNEYPLNQDSMAKRSLSRYLKILAEGKGQVLSGKHQQKPRPASDSSNRAKAVYPYEIVEFDEHRFDLRLTISIVDPYGLETLLEISRIWLLVLIDIASRAILGYSIALGDGFSKEDICEALQASLTPHKKRDLVIPGVEYSLRGGFPSETFPELAYACWEIFRFDNAKAHLSDKAQHALTKIIGCLTDAGPVREPNERPFIERFFESLSVNFSQRLPGTTGSSTKDIKRALGDPHGNLRLLIRLEELEELLDVMVSDYNGMSHEGIGGRSPLEFIGLHLAKGMTFRTLAKCEHRDVILLRESKIVTVKGSLKNGVRPYINFKGVRYSNDILSKNYAMIGKKLVVYFTARNISSLDAFLSSDGSEIGLLVASRPWDSVPHTIKQRQEIFRLIRLGKLRYGIDLLEAYIRYKRQAARSGARAATSFAKAMKSGKATPEDKSVGGEELEITVPQGQCETEGASEKPVIKKLGVRKTLHL